MTKNILTSLHGKELGLSRLRHLVIKNGSISPETGTATATAGAATLNSAAGKVTSEALTTAAAAVYTLTVTNSHIEATDIILASVAYGTSSTGEPAIERVTAGAGSFVIRVKNVAAAAALNGTIVVSYLIIKV